jgi:RNA polymerase sigma factor (TIGR02999 family)
MTTPGDVTGLLKAFGAGDKEALNRLTAMVYDDLRRIAHRHLSRQRRGAGFDTTGLVHEAYLRLIDQTRAGFEDRGHFFAVATLAMRQIALNEARGRRAAKRGGAQAETTLDEAHVISDSDVERLLVIDEAIDKLRQVDERLAQVVEHRVFGGLTDSEIALALDTSERTVQRDWARARAWLAVMLEDHSDRND